MWKTSYRVAILTASDKSFAGRREDKSSPLIQSRMESLAAKLLTPASFPMTRGRWLNSSGNGATSS